MAPQLSLTVLVDNTTLIDRYFIGEPGLSFLLETKGKKILFDTGYSDAFLVNAGRMGISLRDLDYVVLSHGHLDHSGGLIPLARHLTEAKINSLPHKVPDLIAHTRCFYPRPKSPLPNTGSLLHEDEVRRQFNVKLTDKPVWITEDLVFLGEIPRNFSFERIKPGTRKIIMPNGSSEPDLLPDDSALAFRADDGLVIITGCSHAGICNITEYARAICKEPRVIDIIGGFHLLTADNLRIKKTGEYMRELHLKALHACHCTSLAAKLTLASYGPVQETGVGMTIAWQVR
jgi:7,8-dihydropterin-6-yl-methyl-4-(beta-D-ribofuranosyl)aminobenzene 5'-phosphate synthase